MSVADELTKLTALRDSGALTEEEFQQQRAILLAPATPAPAAPPAWGPSSQAGAGTKCGRCSKPLSPAWRGKCNHCGAAYADFPPLSIGTGQPAGAPISVAGKPASGSSRKGCLGIVVIAVVALLVYAGLNAPSGTPSTGDSPAVPGGGATLEGPAAMAFSPVELNGTGAKVAKFTIPEEAAGIATISHRGSSNFSVTSLAADGAHNDLLVNVIGNYSGTVLFDATGHSVAFEVGADGPWTVSIEPLASARAWNPASALTGSGDDVVRLSPSSEGLVTLALTHDGESNFAVTSYGADDRSLLVNEIGGFSGEVALPGGTLLLQVEADGSWTAAPG